jgi:hypothetical protein
MVTFIYQNKINAYKNKYTTFAFKPSPTYSLVQNKAIQPTLRENLK